MDILLDQFLGFPTSINYYIGIFIYSAIILTGLCVDLFLLIWCSTHRIRWSQAVDRFQSRPWTKKDGLIIVLLILFFYVFRLLLSVVVALLPISLSDPHPTGLLLFETLAFPLMALLVTAYLLKSKNLSLRDAFGLRPSSILLNLIQGVVFYLALMPAFFAISLLYMLALYSLGYPLESQVAIQWFLNPDFPLWIKVFLAFLAVCMAPLTEELLFRGITLPAFSKKWRLPSTILLVSFFFSLIHMHVPSLVPITVLAVALSVGYIYSGSILVPIVMHAVFNAVSLLGALLFQETSGLAWILIP